MVRLQRGATPYLLQQRGATWTLRWQEIHAVLRTGDWATPAAKKLLFVELRKLAFGKCAFCEGLLEVTSYLGVEHYVAKTVRPEQAFEWTNLFPVCRLCNNSKSDVDHAGMLLKPDTDDPESMFWLHPDSGKLEARPFLALAVRQRVEQTIEICDLQRGGLCAKRVESMQFTIRWLERLSKRKRLDRLLQEEWKLLTNPRTEHKFVIRHVFETRGEPRLAARDRANFGT
jgi:uncharacterized protein (TIGR02646 family)